MHLTLYTLPDQIFMTRDKKKIKKELNFNCKRQWIILEFYFIKSIAFTFS